MRTNLLQFIIWIALVPHFSLLFSQPVPQSSVSIQAEEFINEQFCFTTTFTLSGDPGYGPYIRIMVPPDVTVNSMSFLGSSLSYTKVGAFPISPLALADPISTDSVKAADGAVAGDTLFIAELPIGSVVSTSPDFNVSICVTFNDAATLDSNYTFTVQPALEFGDTPTGDNGAIYGSASTGQAKPILVRFTKDNDAPEEERPPGPGWPYTYTLSLDIANSKTLTSLSFTDVLPADVTWVGNLTTTGGTGCVASYTPGTRTVSTTCTSAAGSTGAGEVTVAFDVYIQDILNENNCTRDEIPNSAYFTGMYGATVVSPDSARDTLEVEHFSIQTSVSPAQVVPDDTLYYTTVFQITDFDSTTGNLNPIDRLVIEETLPGGVDFVSSISPTIQLSGGTVLSATNITPVQTTLTGDIIQLTFDVHAVTGDLAAGTAGTLTYKALVRQHYDLAGTDPILARDGLTKTITASYDLGGKASSCTDGSSASVTVQPMTPTLSILNPAANTACYVPRESVTFKLTLTVPSGDTEGIIFDNFFPLPVFDVSELDTDNFGSGFDIRLAPDHTDASFVPLVANITKNTSQNSVRIVWPDLEGATTSKTLSVYVDLPIDYQPFDDGLYLSDIFQYQTENSASSTVDSLIVVYLNLCAPDVDIYKGISATDGDGVLDPIVVSNPVTNDITGVDAGDEVTFVLTAVNIGGAKAYDVVVKDSIPAGASNCALIGTDPVKFGTGTAVSGSDYSGSPFDSGGMTIDSLFARNDASKRDTISITCTCDIASGIKPDTVFYNYGKIQWQSAPAVDEPGAFLFTTEIDSASLTVARPSISKALTAISPNGSSNVDVVVPGDTVTYQVTLTLPEGITPALIVADTLPEGLAYVSGSYVVDDAAFTGTVSGSPTVATSGNGTAGNPQIATFDFGSTTTTDNNNDSDDSFVLSLKAVVLDNGANAATASLQEKVNAAELTYTGLEGDAINDTDTTEFAEPDLAISMSMSPTANLDGGDLVTITLTIDNDGTAPAYDITVADDLDGLDDWADLSSMINTTSSMGSWSFGTLGSVVSYTLGGSNALAAGAQQVFTFTVELDDNVTPNTTYQNRATVSGDSEPGSPPAERSTSDNTTETLSTATPTIAKSLTSVSPDGSDGSLATVTTGDTLIYTIQVSLTEGTTTDLLITDNLPPGYQYSNLTISPGTFNGSVSTSPTVTPSGSLSSGRAVDILFSGNTTNTGDNNGANDSFTILLEAVVVVNGANNAQNGLQAKTNEVVLTSSSIPTLDINDTQTHNHAEPKATINKWIDEDTLDAGDVQTIELRVENEGTSMAHDVVVTDTLDADLYDLSSVTLVNAYGFTYSYVSPVVKFTKDTLLSSAGRIDLEFTVAVKTGVVTGTSFENVGIVSASTQSGEPDNERTRTRSNTEDVYTEGIPVMTKSLIGSTDVNTAGTDAGIGEILTYQVAITFPEGLTRENGVDPLLTDTLPAGFQYFASPSQSATISAVADYNGGEISTSVAGTITGTPVSITPSVSGTPATRQVLGFDIGNVTNNDDQVGGDADAEQLILTYEVLVLNTDDNNAGDSKPNYVSLQYQDGSNNPLTGKDTVTLTLTEPNLGMTTSLAPAGGNAYGMNTVTITTKFYNQNTANAATGYNLSFTDDLPAGFLGTGAGANAPTLVSATYSGDGSNISTCFEWGGDGNELLFDATNGGCTLDSLDPGDTLTMVYTAVIDSLADFNETLTTNPDGTITSLNGATGSTSAGGYTAGTADADDGERTGSGANNTSAQAVNDLNTTATDNITLIEPSLTKTGGTSLVIGDSTIMTLTIPIPGGSADDFMIIDNLPSGLRYTAEEVSITLPANVYANNPNPTNSADSDPAVWNFGTLTNRNSSSQNLVIQYEVEVQDILANQDGTDLVNTATLSYTGSSGASSLSDDATNSVIEPNLTIEIEDGGGTYGAGSTIPYTIRIINANNGATAHGVDFASLIPAELLGGSAPFYDSYVITNTGNTAVLTGTATAVSAAHVTLGTSVNTGDQLSLASFDLPSDDTLIITFNATVINNPTAGGAFDVTALADYNSLANNDSRGRDNATNPGSVDDDNDSDLDNYEESGSVTTSLSATVDIVKAFNSFHSTNNFTIGDSVWYDLKVYLPEGIVTSVVVVDSLPDGLGFISATRTGGVNMSFNTGMTHDAVVGNAGKFTFDLKNVTNTADGDASNDTLLLTLKVQILDDAVNNTAGDTQDNKASLTTSVNGTPEESNTITLDIIEPNLVVSITPNNANPSLGEEVTFTVSVNNTGGAVAHDIDMASVLRDLYLTYTGTFTANSSGFSINATDPDSLVFSADQLAAGGNVSFSFVARVDSNATLDSSMTVSIGLTDSYDTQDGTPTSPWVQRDYDASASTLLTPTLQVIEATKTVAYNDGNTNNQLDVGETLTYTIVLTNETGAAADNVIFTDNLPPNITYVGSSLTSTAGTPDASGAPLLSVDVGTMAISATETITFQATVDVGTASGTLISNQGSVDSDQTEPEPTDLDGVDQNGDQPTDILTGPLPEKEFALYAPKVVEWLTDTDASDDVTATDVMRYTFVLENRGSVQLTTVSLTDNIPAGLSLSAAGTPTEGALNTSSFPAISWTGITLDAGETASVTLDVSIDAFGGATSTFTNQGSANSDQTDATGTDSNGNYSDGNQETSFEAVNSGTAASVLDVEKRWVQTLDGDDDGLIDPTDRYRYTITVMNTGSAPATDVEFADAAPTNTVLAGDSVISSQGIIISETSASVLVNLGTLNPGEVATVSMEVSPTGASDGDVIPNQATATSPDANSGSAVSSDDNGNDSDGLNPTQTPVFTGSGSLDATDLTKTLTATSEGGSSGTNVLIGEVLTYQIDIVVPKGYVYEAAIVDTLPEGLIYVAGSAELTRTFTTGLNSSTNPGAVNAASSGTAVALSDGTHITIVGDTAVRVFLGDVINSDTDGTAESYRLTFQAVVSNESGIGNDAGQTLTNDGTFNFLNGINQATTLKTSSDPTVTIHESNVAIDQLSSSPWILTEAGTIEYTLTITNPSGANVATAYDLVVTDSIPFDADEWTGMSIVSSSGTGTAGAITNNSNLGSGQLNIAVDSLPAGESLTIVFRATADGTPELTTEVDSMNNVSWVSATSLPGSQGSNTATPGAAGAINGERTSGGDHPDEDYIDSDTTELEVRDLDLIKTVLNPKSFYSIGDTVEFQLEVAVPDGVTVASNVIQDALPSGQTYITSSLLNASGNDYPAALLTNPGTDFTKTGTGADTLTLNLGTISNSTGSADTIVMTYWAWVDNEMANQYSVTDALGTELENFAQDQFSNPIHPDAAFTDSIADSATVFVGEPHLTLTNTITGGDPFAGGTMNFSVVVANDGVGTAYEVSLSDAITTYLENITALTVSGTTGGAGSPASFTNGGTSWSSSDFDIPPGGSVTITFSADIADDAPLGALDPNTITAQYSSQAGGGSAVERDFSNGGDQDDLVTLNNYTLSQNPSTTLTVFPVELLDFSAIWKNDQQLDADLTWTTASELNNDYFLLERSFDHQEWTVIGQISGAGNSTVKQTYQWSDIGVGIQAHTGSVLYRLQQVDFDGATQRLPVIELFRNAAFGPLLVWPNPFDEELSLNLGGRTGIYQIRLLDSRGRAVRDELFDPLDKLEILRLNGLTNLATGTYFLSIEYADGRQQLVKVIKKG